MKFETRAGRHQFEVQVCFNGLDQELVCVEPYADGIMGGAPVRREMEHFRNANGAGADVYPASVPAGRPPTDYTVRVIPHYAGVAMPLEDPRILWQR